ncbi:MAG: biotin synthase BioB [Bacteroidales bacterium]
MLENKWLEAMLQKVFNGDCIDFDEANKLLSIEEKEEFYWAANEIRSKFLGEKIDLCTISNAKSGKCSENCKWCAQSASYNTHSEEYDLIAEEQALSQARKNAEYGVHKFSLVTSGKRLSQKNLERVCNIYKKIEGELSIGLCASMGLMSREDLQKLKDSGVKHYHCNLETAPSFFPNLCTSHTIEQKIQTLKWAQEIGLKVCSGGIIGMGESMAQRVEMAFALRELKVKSIPLNILNPIQGTPLEKTPSLSDEEIMDTFAIFRFINPQANIRFAGGRNKIKHLQERLLKAGVSAALVGDLLTTVGTNVSEDVCDFQKAGFKLS